MRSNLPDPQNYFQVLEKYLSGGMCGYDREGSPIWYDVIGPVDPKGLFLSAPKQDFIKSKIRDCEMLSKECNLQSQRVQSTAHTSSHRVFYWWAQNNYSALHITALYVPSAVKLSCPWIFYFSWRQTSWGGLWSRSRWSTTLKVLAWNTCGSLL